MNLQKTHTRNTFLNATGEGLWGFAWGFHNMNSIIPMFLAQMGASAFLIGLIPGGFILILAIPQLLSAALFHQSPNIKKLNVGIHFALTPIIVLMGVAFYVFKLDGQTGVMVYMILWLCWTLGIGFLVPIWADFLAAVTVQERRGRFFGITFTVSAIMEIGGGYAMKKVLEMEGLTFPENFGLAFLIMATAMLVGNIFFIFIKVIHPPQSNSIKQDNWYTRLMRIYKQDKNFRNYIISRALGSAYLMPLAFYGVDLMERFHLPLSSAGAFTFFLVLGQALSNIAFGYLGDIYGRKRAVAGFFVAHLLAGVTVVLATAPWMAYMAFFFVGIGFGVIGSSFMVFIYEFAGEEGDKKLYYAALETALAPFLVVYISIAGAIAETFGYTSLYCSSLIVIAVALWIFILKVKSPTRVSAAL